MRFDRIRQSFKPLFGLDRSDAVARLLYNIVGGVILVDLLDIVLRLLSGNTWNDPAQQVLVVLLLMQFGLLFALSRGYIHQTAVMLAIFSWIGVTYLIWNAYGLHDV